MLLPDDLGAGGMCPSPGPPGGKAAPDELYDDREGDDTEDANGLLSPSVAKGELCAGRPGTLSGTSVVILFPPPTREKSHIRRSAAVIPHIGIHMPPLYI